MISNGGIGNIEYDRGVLNPNNIALTPRNWVALGYQHNITDPGIYYIEYTIQLGGISTAFPDTVGDHMIGVYDNTNKRQLAWTGIWVYKSGYGCAHINTIVKVSSPISVSPAFYNNSSISTTAKSVNTAYCHCRLQ